MNKYIKIAIIASSASGIYAFHESIESKKEEELHRLAVAGGFSGFPEYKSALEKGFIKKDDYEEYLQKKQEMEKYYASAHGFSERQKYQDAVRLGIPSNSEYAKYLALSAREPNEDESIETEEYSPLSGLKNGSITAWYVITRNQDYLSEPNCSKSLQYSQGLIATFKIDGKYLVTDTTWAGGTKEEEKSSVFFVNPETGFERMKLKVLRSSNSGGITTIEGVRHDNAIVKYSFSEELPRKLKLVSVSIIKDGKESPEAGFEPVELALCPTSNYEEFLATKKHEYADPSEVGLDALSYVLDKKWSLANVGCLYDGGAYQVFSMRLPSGYAMYTRGEPSIAETRQEYSFQRIGQRSFSLTQRFWANGFIKQQARRGEFVSSEIRTEVSLDSTQKITYRRTSKTIDLMKLLDGTLSFKTNTESGFGYLCMQD